MGYLPNKAIHPGAIVARILEREKMSQKNLSERTGLTEKHISQIINGEASLTVDTSLLLENTLSGPASFWINLEKNYQEIKARIERTTLLKKEVALLPKFPYAELVKQRCVKKTLDKLEKVENLWKFFGVSSLEFVRETEAVAFRKNVNAKIKSESIAAWLRCGELKAKEQELPSYSVPLLKQSLQKLRKLTLQTPEEFSVDAKDTLKEAGVALIYTPHFAGTGVKGAVRWINDLPVIQISLLGGRTDIFWFTLFHEVGHLILHGKKDKFIEFDDRNLSTVQDKEKEADEFSTNQLIPQSDYYNFIAEQDFSRKAIRDFAKTIEIGVDIVAGRLCHEKLIPWSLASNLRGGVQFAKK